MRLARAAGAVVEAFRASGYITSGKSDRSPVTEADIAADQLITEGLRRERPGVAILSEESRWDEVGGDELWCIDPIDGTEAFIAATKAQSEPSGSDAAAMRGYAIQIAKLEFDGRLWRPVVGVVFEPNYGELFAAIVGEPLIFERSGTRVALAPTRARRVVTSSRETDSLRQALFAKGYGDGGLMRSVGIKIGAMIKGLAEVYPSPAALSYWDLAAPQVILEAAGGVVTDIHGNPPVYAPEGRLSGEMKVAAPMLMTLGVDHQGVLDDLRSCAETFGQG